MRTLSSAKRDPIRQRSPICGNIGRRWGLAFRKDGSITWSSTVSVPDLAEIIARISRYAAAADGTDADAVADELRGNFRNGWATSCADYGSYARRCADYLRHAAPNLLQWVKMRRRHSAPRERRRVLATLRNDGAAEDYVTAFGAELAHIEDVLSGAAFDNFIRPYVPLFVAATAPSAANDTSVRLGPVGRVQSPQAIWVVGGEQPGTPHSTQEWKLYKKALVVKASVAKPRSRKSWTGRPAGAPNTF